MKPLYRTVIILASIAVISYLAVDIFYKAVSAGVVTVRKEEKAVEKDATARITLQEPIEAYAVITARNLFGSAKKEDSAKDEAPINLDELEPTKLKLTLLGTVSGSVDFDYAVIEEEGTRKQGLFRTGDTVAGAAVKKIMRTRVILRVGDKDEILAMEEKKKDGAPVQRTAQQTVASGPPRKITVDKDVIDEALEDVSKIMTQVRVRPYFSGGKPDGFMVSRIAPDSLFQQMGLQNGDVIQGVNGEPLGSPKDVLEMYGKLESGSEITLNIKRRGRPETLQYTFRE